jgi:tripartite-type tricarboxylate transporter receptor subunit TctC
MAPAKTPPQVIAKLSAALQMSLQDPELRAKIKATDAEIRWAAPENYRSFMNAELHRWGAIVKAAGLKPE